MREILFKAQRKDGKGWVYGLIIKRKTKYFIEVELEDSEGNTIYKAYEIIPETVCQYTGLKDKNGVKIFSKDRFFINDKFWFVQYITDRCGYVLTTGLGYDTKNCIDLDCDTIYYSEILGNIHDKTTSND